MANGQYYMYVEFSLNADEKKDKNGFDDKDDDDDDAEWRGWW